MNSLNSPKKILIVDDEPNLEFFDLMLSKLGFRVEKASDGVEAMEKVGRFCPDLILLENIMPRMSGWECTKILKADPQFREIPIIMFSSLDDVKDKVAGFELGVNDYITKPFNFSEVLVRIRVALRNRELFTQIGHMRESCLTFAEALSRDIKTNLADFVRSIDALDAVIVQLTPGSTVLDPAALSSLMSVVSNKSQAVRKQIAELDARIEKTIIEWEDIKKSNHGLSVEAHIRSPIHQ
ncbi:MAG: response regulator [Treponema sp.]|jgi:DNA-binding response OmpR family regulator|nr:response regulator [Treponema sp.]